MRDTARRTIKALARAADPLLARPGLTVLAYHRVGPGPAAQMRLDREVFAEQMAWLAEHAEVRSLDDWLGASGGPANKGTDVRPAVALTFDDGTADFATLALPILGDLGLPATLYLCTQPVEDQAPWPDGAPPLTWDQVASWAASPLVHVGCHTHRHFLADRTAPAEAAEDLDRSIALIVQHAGEPPRHFAYPKAVDASPAVAALVAQRFLTAALAGTRSNPLPLTDPLRLARSPIQHADDRQCFESKVRGGMRLEDDLRRIANRVRYRGRVN